MTHDARFYFANLCADVARCASAAQVEDMVRYQRMLTMARRSLGFLRKVGHSEAYEEGLLLLRGLELAREDGNIKIIQEWLGRNTPAMV